MRKRGNKTAYNVPLILCDTHELKHFWHLQRALILFVMKMNSTGLKATSFLFQRGNTRTKTFIKTKLYRAHFNFPKQQFWRSQFWMKQLQIKFDPKCEELHEEPQDSAKTSSVRPISNSSETLTTIWSVFIDTNQTKSSERSLTRPEIPHFYFGFLFTST